jgi:hypothetical protein
MTDTGNLRHRAETSIQENVTATPCSGSAVWWWLLDNYPAVLQKVLSGILHTFTNCTPVGY